MLACFAPVYSALHTLPLRVERLVLPPAFTFPIFIYHRTIIISAQQAWNRIILSTARAPFRIALFFTIQAKVLLIHFNSSFTQASIIFKNCSWVCALDAGVGFIVVVGAEGATRDLA